MDDEQLAALREEVNAKYRAEIPVHCGGCGATFPGDTKLNNGLCRECCRSPIHLVRKVERYRKALEELDQMHDDCTCRAGKKIIRRALADD